MVRGVVTATSLSLKFTRDYANSIAMKNTSPTHTSLIPSATSISRRTLYENQLPSRRGTMDLALEGLFLLERAPIRNVNNYA